jgi:hypothetical protein
VVRKWFLFALQVAREVAIRMRQRTSIDFVGSGSMEASMRAYADEITELVDFRFHGYIS